MPGERSSPPLRTALPIAVAAALLVAGCTAAPGGDGAPEPRLASFTAAGGACVNGTVENASTDLRVGQEQSVVVVSGSLPVPDVNYAIDDPSLVETGPGRWALNLTASEETQKAPRDCTAVAEYTAVVNVPREVGNATITVRHDGEVVTRAIVASGGGNGTATRAPA